MAELHYRIRLADWQSDQRILRLIREHVFITEQHVPAELEWDGIDDQCIHVIAETTDGVPIGTARLLSDGHIGRMAVLKNYRGHGVGRALLETLLQKAKTQDMRTVILNAQTHALAFYEASGFKAYGEEFLEADIPHRHMKLEL